MGADEIEQEKDNTPGKNRQTLQTTFWFWKPKVFLTFAAASELKHSSEFSAELAKSSYPSF